MLSALIPSRHSYPAFALGRTTGTPEVSFFRSSRTEKNSSSSILRPHQIETDNNVTLAKLSRRINISADLCISLCSSDCIISAYSGFWRTVSEDSGKNYQSFLLIVPTEEFLLFNDKYQSTKSKINSNFKI